MKPVRVIKYGGTSVATPDHMERIVSMLVAQVHHAKLVVVVSAMGNTTQTLIEKANQQGITDKKDMDAFLAQGEDASAALFCKILQDANIPATVMHPRDIPMRTNDHFGDASIESINPHGLLKALQHHGVVVVPGFQGTYQNHTTTLGRGGSDLTAVALAITLGLDQCEICTDVPGVMTTDPKVYERARTLTVLSYEEMICMSYAGAKVLQPRCVVMAKRYGLKIIVRSTFEASPGTIVEKDRNVENKIISGIALKQDVSLFRFQHPLSKTRAVLDVVKDHDVEWISVSSFEGEQRCLLMVPLGDASDFGQALQSLPDVDHVKQSHVACVSIVGSGLQLQKNLIFEVQACLWDQDIPVHHVQMLDSVCKVIVDHQDAHKTVRGFHDLFGLEKEPN